MPSWKKCIFGCQDDWPLYSLPKDKAVCQKWLNFLGGNNPPSKKSCFVCAGHFTDDCFLNKNLYDCGLVTKLSLKDGAIPTLKKAYLQYQGHFRGFPSEPQPSALHPSMLTPLDTSTQTDTQTCTCGATQLLLGKSAHHVSSKGTQTESFVTRKSIATSTDDASWWPVALTPIKSEDLTPCKRPRLDEEDEVEILTLKIEPHDSTSEPGQPITNVAELSPLIDTSSSEHKDSKYTAFEKNLMELFQTCPKCRLVSQLKTYGRGPSLSVDQKCPHCGYSKQLDSQPVIGSPSLENVQLSAAILFTGSA